MTHLKKKAQALHQVNPALVSGGEGAAPAVVVRKVEGAEWTRCWSFVGRKQHPDGCRGRSIIRRAGYSPMSLVGEQIGCYCNSKPYSRPSGFAALTATAGGLSPTLGSRPACRRPSEGTQQLERKHLTLRTWIKRLVRKTICFSTSVQMPRATDRVIYQPV